MRVITYYSLCVGHKNIDFIREIVYKYTCKMPNGSYI